MVMNWKVVRVSIPLTWTGCDFKLRAKKVAGYPNYDSSEFHPSGTLEDLDDAQLESIWKGRPPPALLVTPDQFKSYDQLKEHAWTVSWDVLRTPPEPTDNNHSRGGPLSSKPQKNLIRPSYPLPERTR